MPPAHDLLGPELHPAVLKSRIDSHEAVCATRYLEMQATLLRVQDRTDRLQYWMVGILLTGLGTLISALWQVASRVK